MQSPGKIAEGSKSWSTQGTDRLHPLHFSATERKRAEGAEPEELGLRYHWGEECSLQDRYRNDPGNLIGRGGRPRRVRFCALYAGGAQAQQCAAMRTSE